MVLEVEPLVALEAQALVALGELARALVDLVVRVPVQGVSVEVVSAQVPALVPDLVAVLLTLMQ